MQDICFGWDRATDEESLRKFLHRFGSDMVLEALVPRLTEEEITTLVSSLTRIMRNHFSEKEYHRLFLSPDNGA